MARVGIIGTKLGMSSVFLDDGKYVGVTLVHVDNCQVVGQHEYACGKVLVVGAKNAKMKNVTKPLAKSYEKKKIAPKMKVVGFKVDDDNVLDTGVDLNVDFFKKGQFIDVIGTSIGKGFAGGIKRHGFKMQCASHGVSISHRALGSTGQCQDPGKVFKNKKMAGHMGDKRRTLQNLQVVDVLSDKNVILIKGGIPGSKGSFVYISDAKKKN